MVYSAVWVVVHLHVGTHGAVVSRCTGKTTGWDSRHTRTASHLLDLSAVEDGGARADVALVLQSRAVDCAAGT
jgi:hypothetical protein